MSRRTRMLVASAAAVLVMVPGIALAGAGTGNDTDDEAQMMRDVMRVAHANFVAYNDKKWDEFRLTFTDDALMLPPNQEPVRGPGAITDLHRDLRDVVGAVDLESFEVVRPRANGKIANLVYTFTTQSHVRLMSDVLYERQPNGSVLLGVLQVGLREQPVG